MEDFINDLLASFTLPNIEEVEDEELLNCAEISEDLEYLAEFWI